MYRISVYQSILVATLLAKLKKGKMQDLGPRINYPVFLEDASEIPRVAVTLHYDEFTFFGKSGWETNFSSIELVKKRLQAQEG